MPDVNIDLIGKDQNNKMVIEGAVANTLAQASPNGLHVNNFRPFIGKDGKPYINRIVGNKVVAVPATVNAALRRDEWITLDETVLKISRERIGGFQDIISRGLTYNLTNPMGKTVLEYHDQDDPGEAIITMDAVTRGSNDAPNYTTNYIPLPIVHGDFVLNERLLQSSRNMGESIDTSMVESVTRRVLEKLEDMLFTSTSYTFGGGTIYGYLNHPNRNTVTLSVNWDASAKTAANIKDDVLAMKAALIAAKHFGPYMLYIPTDYETVLDDDYDTTTSSGRTIRQRIMEIEGIMGIKVIDRLTADNIVLAQLTSDVIRIINGFSPRVVQWSSQGGMVHHFKIMAIQVPQVRADQSGNSGICHLAA